MAQGLNQAKVQVGEVQLAQNPLTDFQMDKIKKTNKRELQLM